MKTIGQIIELDPEKYYVMLLEQHDVSAENAQKIFREVISSGHKISAICVPNLGSVQFVENANKIIDVKLKGDASN